MQVANLVRRLRHNAIPLHLTCRYRWMSSASTIRASIIVAAARLVRCHRPQSGDGKRHAVRPLHLSVAATCDVAASPVLITLSKSPDPREHRASSQLIIAITVSCVARCLPWAFADGSWLGAENTLAHLEASFVHIEATLECHETPRHRWRRQTPVRGQHSQPAPCQLLGWAQCF